MRRNASPTLLRDPRAGKKKKHTRLYACAFASMHTFVRACALSAPAVCVPIDPGSRDLRSLTVPHAAAAADNSRSLSPSAAARLQQRKHESPSTHEEPSTHSLLHHHSIIALAPRALQRRSLVNWPPPDARPVSLEAACRCGGEEGGDAGEGKVDEKEGMMREAKKNKPSSVRVNPFSKRVEGKVISLLC